MTKVMRTGWVVMGAVCLFLVLVSWAQESPAKLNRYVLKVAFDPEDRTISGTATVDYTNDSVTELSSLYFLLMPNYSRAPNPQLAPAVLDSAYWSGFDPAWTRIFSVKTPDGATLDFALE
ncbi:MAG: hypothetical protein N3E42_04955, partial [Candidatus Bipolaricaulota bacterium]|nr:hypothetical protein [Candidatus Bipolaricaulota bacterium]